MLNWIVLIPTVSCADGKTFKKPRRPFEKERLDSELKLVGEFGLRNKRELWRVQMALSKIRQVGWAAAMKSNLYGSKAAFAAIISTFFKRLTAFRSVSDITLPRSNAGLAAFSLVSADLTC